MTTIRYFAGAADAAGVETETLSGAAKTVADLRSELARRHGPEFTKVLTVCTLLVDGVCEADSAVIPSASVVDVLPPFAGG